jgi:hypothetical protein
MGRVRPLPSHKGEAMKRTERIKLDFLFPGDEATTEITIKVRKNGFIKLAIIDAVNLAITNSATITFKDVDNYELFSSGAITGGNTTPTRIGNDLVNEAGLIPCEPNYTCTCTIATALAAAKIVTVIFYVDANSF